MPLCRHKRTAAIPLVEKSRVQNILTFKFPLPVHKNCEKNFKMSAVHRRLLRIFLQQGIVYKNKFEKHVVKVY
jgi:hypothetical protein